MYKLGSLDKGWTQHWDYLMRTSQIMSASSVVGPPHENFTGNISRHRLDPFEELPPKCVKASCDQYLVTCLASTGHPLPHGQLPVFNSIKKSGVWQTLPKPHQSVILLGQRSNLLTQSRQWRDISCNEGCSWKEEEANRNPTVCLLILWLFIFFPIISQ